MSTPSSNKPEITVEFLLNERKTILDFYFQREQNIKKEKDDGIKKAIEARIEDVKKNRQLEQTILKLHEKILSIEQNEKKLHKIIDELVISKQNELYKQQVELKHQHFEEVQTKMTEYEHKILLEKEKNEKLNNDLIIQKNITNEQLKEIKNKYYTTQIHSLEIQVHNYKKLISKLEHKTYLSSIKDKEIENMTRIMLDSKKDIKENIASNGKINNNIDLTFLQFKYEEKNREEEEKRNQVLQEKIRTYENKIDIIKRRYERELEILYKFEKEKLQYENTKSENIIRKKFEEDDECLVIFDCMKETKDLYTKYNDILRTYNSDIKLGVQYKNIIFTKLDFTKDEKIGSLVECKAKSIFTSFPKL